jgi:hypothetical protein
MKAHELDTLYTALSAALGRVDEEKASLLLATLALDLLAHHADPAIASAAIERAGRLCGS